MPPWERMLLELLREVDGLILPADVLMVEELAQNYECPIGFENLCSQLFDYGVRLPRTLVSRFAALENEMGIDPHYWEMLEDNCNVPPGNESS